MDVRVMISPELAVDADEFVAAWNADAGTRAKAEARVDTDSTEAFLGGDVVDIIVLALVGFAGSILATSVKNALTESFTEFFKEKLQPEAPAVTITWIEEDGGLLMVVSERK